jgi:hypothetical protein
LQSEQLKAGQWAASHDRMREDSKMDFCDNVNRRLEHVPSVNIVVIIRPATVNVCEGLSFFSTSNVS